MDLVLILRRNFLLRSKVAFQLRDQRLGVEHRDVVPILGGRVAVQVGHGRSPVTVAGVEGLLMRAEPIGRLGWVVTKQTVVYDYAASNGGVHTYYHDPTTGRTYQSSAYW